jgi:amidase
VSDLHDLTAVEQGAAVRRGEASPAQLAQHYLDRADEVGAFVTRTPELASARAESLLPVPEDAGPV